MRDGLPKGEPLTDAVDTLIEECSEQHELMLTMLAALETGEPLTR